MSLCSSDYGSSDPDFEYRPPPDVVFSLQHHLRSVRVLSRREYLQRRSNLIPEFCSLVDEVLDAYESDHRIDEEELVALPWVLSDALFLCHRQCLPHTPRMVRAGAEVLSASDSLRVSVHPDQLVPDWTFLFRLPSILDSKNRLHRFCDLVAVSLRQRRPSCRAISSHLNACLDFVYSAVLPLWVVK